MEIQTIVFSIARVLTPSLEAIVLQCVDALGGDSHDPTYRNRVRDLCENYYRGEIHSDHLLNQIIERAGIQVQRPEFLEAIREHMEFDREVLKVADELNEQYDVGFFCELPKSWVSDSWDHLDLPAGFLLDDITFNEGIEIEDPSSTQFENLLQEFILPAEQILLIDARNKVTSRAVRMGVNAILYVNPFRLRQELSLRGMLTTH